REVFEGAEYHAAVDVLKSGRLQAATDKPAIRMATPAAAPKPQHEPVASEPSAGPIEYWRKQLAGRLPVLEWPSDRVRPPVALGDRVTQTISLPKELRQGVQALGEAEATSWCTVLATGVAAVLARYTGQEDLLLGGFSDGQFVPLRMDLSGD